MAQVAGVANEVVEIMGQRVPVERFVEADVGMSFPKTELSERLFSDPTGTKAETGKAWPDEFPFPPEAFRRQDDSDDADFYSMPRLCYHIDEGAVRSLTNYYRESIAPGSSVLDICSSWVSHYPADFPQKMGRISGTGMNLLELQNNQQLSDFEPKNLNIDPTLPYEAGSFDVVTCVVSVDYLIKPLEIFKEVHRVLKPGGKFILSQSNRCFPNKAIAMWLGQSDLQHCQVIGAYFHYSGGWDGARAFDVSPTGPRTNDPLFIVEATKL
jgi:SAM-dependent methyltransferase